MKRLTSLLLSIALLVSILPSIPQTDAHTISPHTLDLVLKPGETYTDTFLIWDETNTGTAVQLEEQRFTIDSETGKFSELIEIPNGDDNWIVFDRTEAALPASGDTVDVPFTLTVPNDVRPGTHQISVAFTPLEQLRSADETEEDQGSAVNFISTSVANIFVRIAGTAIEDGDIEVKAITKDEKYFKTDEDHERGYAERKWFESTPIYFAVTFNNTGNVHLKPDGNVKIVKNSGEILYKEPLDEKASIVPNSAKKEYIVGPYENTFAFGRYNIEAQAVYGENPQLAKDLVEVLVIPWKWLLLALILLILLLLILWYTRRKLKQRQKQRLDEEKDEYRKIVAEEMRKANGSDGSNGKPQV